jgi:hypothetical protein
MLKLLCACCSTMLFFAALLTMRRQSCDRTTILDGKASTAIDLCIAQIVAVVASPLILAKLLYFHIC